MCTILIAEDNKTIRNNITLFLTAEGFDILPAQNGLEAYKLALANKPDIILSDIHMPVMDGLELSRRLQDNQDTKMIPLILLTADSELMNNNRGNSCANEWISKPFYLNELLTSINKVRGIS